MLTQIVLYGIPLSENIATVLDGLIREGDTVLDESTVTEETWKAFQSTCDALGQGRIRKFNMTLVHELNPNEPVEIPPIEDRIKAYVSIITQEKEDAADVVTLRRSYVESIWKLVKELKNTKEGKSYVSELKVECSMTEEEKEKYAHLLAAKKALCNLVSEAEMVTLCTNGAFDNL